jgi:isopentenyl diphosphate isomerase/L-lactate dehydrogenase-like FMN-dependent dehydrogenase
MHMLGFDLRLRSPNRLISIEDYRREARRVLPRMAWSYIDGGADDEVSLADNRTAFNRWALRSRVLTGNDRHDLRTTVGGVPLDLPVLLGPTGFAGLSHWQGDVAAARAAQRRGTRYVSSTVSSWSIEEIALLAGRGHFFQLYANEGGLTAQLMQRAWNAGIRVMFVTVDVPVRGNREGERRTGMGIPPTLTPREGLNVLRHPGWAFNVLRHRRIGGRNLVEDGGVSAAVESIEIQERELSTATLSWDDLAWMRSQWKGVLYVKGILDPEDAKHAIALGAEGVVVSNHGGRQLDHAVAPLDVLPEIAAAVGGQAEVLLDGGIRRGTDVIKALCLGAKAVLLGRAYLYGLAINGEQGVVNVLRILQDEIERAMSLMGVSDVGDLDRNWIVRKGENELLRGEQIRSHEPDLRLGAQDPA